MSVPEGISPYAEVMLCLPADWPLKESYPGNPDVDWPITLLKQVARLPHEYGTWIGPWHSLPNGDPAEPYAASTPFAGAVITPMLRVPAEARSITVPGGTAPDGTEINVLAVVPLHRDEVAVKIERGTDALIEVLDRGRVTELLDPSRPSFAVVR
ncbi:suppressor of fused domain protein [Actinoplanes sp. NPDC023801]|uniref:suppressor of fused domain protein n=1 Tax=Actinoplanes sp. NPDC023801 TaxID=3154595 RepID=UPI00340A45A9